ncbi:uncharacterized protein GLRG_08200 [Colletotrichum graminicola M1.001]|uniref:Uncharacterized protein n=1 Tax=Colletotrichum graminicola (strain M1.001 / M2 / FGSC 10212) TaxID=645133 RepID=E3QQB8_COLGM|nr:uncharacterized protein GLRG_08200 [Colletotrichum graminicola M1.001]EFQ33056.1 hypothetical protein GLRG_08200 [Colletotrichum graminicola M1.001]
MPGIKFIPEERLSGHQRAPPEPVEPLGHVRFSKGRAASTFHATDDASRSQELATVPLRRPPRPRLRRAIRSLWR